MEFIAKDRSAFQTILADSTIQTFETGKDKTADIEKALQKYRKDLPRGRNLWLTDTLQWAPETRLSAARELDVR